MVGPSTSLCLGLLVQTRWGRASRVACTCGAIEATPKWVGGATVVHGPFLCRAVEGARSGLQALSPHVRSKEMGQEPELGWRGATLPLPKLTRVCVTSEKVWVPVPLPRIPREVIDCFLPPRPPQPLPHVS